VFVGTAEEVQELLLVEDESDDGGVDEHLEAADAWKDDERTVISIGFCA